MSIDTARTMSAIPTTYKGINFRSRLEAKWAVMFDLLGWRWDYEPIDFDGYIPDFIIYGHVQNTNRDVLPVYVEVKPIFEYDDVIANNVANAVGLEHPNCDNNQQGTYREVLICGARLPLDKEESVCFEKNCYGIGWFFGGYPAHVFKRDEPNGYGLSSAANIYNYYDLLFNWGEDWFEPADPSDLWAKATNKVQWLRRRS